MANSVLNQIKTQVNIVDVVAEYIDIAKKGKNFVGLCPFHQDNNPSMSISPEKQLFKCFACGAGGDVVKFVSDFNKITFLESLKLLGKKIGVNVKLYDQKVPTYSQKEEKLVAILKEAMEFYQYAITTDEGTQALEYAQTRKLDTQTREKFLIGYAPYKGLVEFLEKKGYDKATIINASLVDSYDGDFFKNRLIFGLTNQHGDVVGFSARDFSGNNNNIKYINSANNRLFSKSSLLYNFCNAQDAIKKEGKIFINEGFMDVIAMSKAGYKNSVAIMGTFLTKEHIAFLLGKKVVLMFDGDQAGVLGVVKSIKILLNNRIDTFVVSNFSNQDPDEILCQLGVEKLKQVVENQVEALEFIYKIHQKQHQNLTPTTIQDFINSFVKYLVNASQITRDFYINKLSQDLQISKEIISSYIPKVNIVTTQTTKDKNNAPQYVHVYFKLMKAILGKPDFAKMVQQSNINYGNIVWKQTALCIIDTTLNNKSKGPSDIQNIILNSKKESPDNEFKKNFNKILEVQPIMKNEYNKAKVIEELIKRVKNEAINEAMSKYENKLDDPLTNANDKKNILEGSIKLVQLENEEQ